MSFSALLFYFFSVVLLASAVGVVAARQPVHAALSLILAFFTTAALWILLGAEFLGLALIIIYVGAVMVFFLFVIMMVNVRNPDKIKTNWGITLPPLILIGVMMFAELAMLIIHGMQGQSAVMPAPENGNTLALGQAMFNHYIYPLEVIAILLLSAMVAAIALTQRKNPLAKRQDPAEQIATKAEDRLRLIKMPTETEEDIDESLLDNETADNNTETKGGQSDAGN